VTDLTEDAPAAGLVTIGHDIADVDAQRNATLRLATFNTFTTTDGQVNAIQTSVFFIAPGAGENNLGNTPLSLWRKSGLEAPVELVEGVENLQVLFGVDSDADGAPNQYVVPNLVVDFNDVVTVRVTLTVNSIDDVGGRTAPTHGCDVQGCIGEEDYDGLLRRTMTQTFKLRNTG
jgi:type IV pilus assembly protein PilW